MATLNPSADTVMISDGADTNYGTSGSIHAGEAYGQTSKRRSLIKFDLTSYAGMVAAGATLRLYDDGTDYCNNARTMKLFRSKRPWTEAGCTWNKYNGTTAWTTAGSGSAGNDYDSNVVGSISLPNPPSAGYVEIPLTVSYINEWLNGTMTNNGFFLMMDTESDDMHVFNSKDAASNKPELILTFGGAKIVNFI